MLISRSKNSYIRSPRRVTETPIGIPSRSLKEEIAFFARRITGFWPVILPISSAAASSTLIFRMASPTPILITIFVSRGTAIRFLYPSPCKRRGRISLRYFSFNRGVGPFDEASGAVSTGAGAAVSFFFSFFSFAINAILNDPESRRIWRKRAVCFHRPNGGVLPWSVFRTRGKRSSKRKS